MSSCSSSRKNPIFSRIAWVSVAKIGCWPIAMRLSFSSRVFVRLKLPQSARLRVGQGLRRKNGWQALRL